MSKQTQMMGSIGLSWSDITSTVNHVVNMIQNDGETVLDFAKNTLKLVAAVADRDLGTILTSFQGAKTDITKLIVDIKAEFGL